MKNYILIALSIGTTLCSCTCSKDKNEQAKPLWSFDAYDRADFNDSKSIGNNFYEYPICNNTIVVAGNKNKNAIYYNLNIDNGNKNWELIYNSPGGPFSIWRPYLKDNYWYFGDREKLYRVKIMDGKKEELTIRNSENQVALDHDIVGLDNYLFAFDFYEHIYYCTTEGFNMNSFKMLPDVKHQVKYFFSESKKTYLSYLFMYPFLNQQNEICLLIGYRDVDDNNKELYKTSLYNIIQEKFIFDGVDILNQKPINNNISINNLYVNQTYFDYNTATLKVFCIDINTGNLIWLKELRGGKSHVITDKVFYTTGTSPTKILIYNKSDGKLLTEKPLDANAASNMIKYNGVIYYVEEGSRIRAIDAETGEYLMKISNPPDAKPFNIWGSSIAVANGKIIVDNYKNVYAYPTIR